MGFQQTSEFEFAISAHDRVGIDGQIDRQLADGRQLISGVQRAGGDATADLIDELTINGNAAVKVDRELDRGRVFIPSHGY